MGTLQDHFMWISSSEERIYEFHSQAVNIFSRYGTMEDLPLENLVSPVLPSVANGFASFFIAPDGSKEGWGTSDTVNQARAKLIEKLESNDAPWCDWMEVTTGELGTRIVQGSMIHNDEEDE